MMLKWIKDHWALLGLIVAIASIPSGAWIFNIGIIDAILGILNLILKVLNYKIPIWLIIPIIFVILLIIKTILLLEGKQYFYTFEGVRWKLCGLWGRYDIVNHSAYCPKCNEELQIIYTDRFNGMIFNGDRLVLICRSCDKGYPMVKYPSMREILDHLRAFIESGKIKPGDLEEIPD